MASLNKVMIIGNVGTDPEMRFTPDGRPFTTFRVAVSRNFTTRSGERKQETEWFSVLTWDRQAESCNQFLAKGRRVYVEGRLRSRSWEGKDGISRFTNEIIASRVIFLERPPQVATLPEEVPEVEEEAPPSDIPQE